ncbi:MAG: hypothetical protein WC531_01260 [Candidatus Paceibacterota bacterium]|jgi:capsule polysaccharide export protein KpsC/LpsZ
MEKIKKVHLYAFDFDGVIAQYDGFKGTDHFGPPIESVVKAIRILKEQGHKIIIYSTRGEEMLKKYCSDNDIPVDYINKNPEKEGENPGKPIAYVYVDDRAVCYRGQTAEELVEEILKFKVHWQE